MCCIWVLQWDTDGYWRAGGETEEILGDISGVILWSRRWRLFRMIIRESLGMILVLSLIFSVWFDIFVAGGFVVKWVSPWEIFAILTERWVYGNRGGSRHYCVRCDRFYDGGEFSGLFWILWIDFCSGLQSKILKRVDFQELIFYENAVA